MPTKGTVAAGPYRLADQEFRLELMDYHGGITAKDDTRPDSPLHYIENRDHSRFVFNFNRILRDNDLLRESGRGLWTKSSHASSP